ncbi:MAG TPA: hypothetical protein VHO29_07080 [Marmoricola sp.]|nr:hypothetical protein [Marmoricola sp.]
MSATNLVKAWISGCLKDAGFEGRASLWRIRGPEVQWVVQIEDLPHGSRLGVDVGLDLQSGSNRRRPTDCPILLHLENLPTAGDFAVMEALDMSSTLTPDRRREEIEGAIRALAEYVTNHGTLSSLRAAYQDGDLRSAFVRKDARVTLQGAETL